MTGLDALDVRLAELPRQATGFERAEHIVTASVEIFTASPATYRPAIAALLVDHLGNGPAQRAQATWSRCRDLQSPACRQAQEENDLVGQSVQVACSQVSRATATRGLNSQPYSR